MGNYIGCGILGFFIVPVLELITFGLWDSTLWWNGCIANNAENASNSDGANRVLLRGGVDLSAIDTSKPLDWIKPQE